MVAIMRGIVKDGKVIPERPLPEGETVEIGLLRESGAFTKEEQEEFDLWSAHSGDALIAMEAMLDQEEFGRQTNQHSNDSR